MKHLFFIIALLLIVAIVKPGCKNEALEKCDAVCEAQGLECASVTAGFIDKYTCREKTKPGVNLNRR